MAKERKGIIRTTVKGKKRRKFGEYPEFTPDKPRVLKKS